jgi:hypothetical protein
MTVWNARRSGNRILCGRQVNGRYVCQGVVALVFGSATIEPPPEMVEDPPGFLRPTTRRLRKEADRRRSKFPGPDDEDRLERPSPRLPWRTACPHCKALVEVSRDSAIVMPTTDAG